jgi:tRNA(Ile2) C34 agmatinyltransferase TiaS
MNDKIAPPGTEYTDSVCPFCGSHLIVAGRWLWQCATCGKGALTHNPVA